MTLIVLTNDDGIDSPGLLAMAEAIGERARLAVIAPLHNQSAVSHAITLRNAIEVHDRTVPGATRAWAVDGTPADCVRLASLGLAGERPDMIVSGANLGLNLGDDLAYSGTAAAAIEASLNGMPGIAISQQTLELELGFPRSDRYDFSLAQRFIGQLVDMMLGRGGHDLRATMRGGMDSAGSDTDVKAARSSAVMLNVNVPGIPPEDSSGVRITQPCYRFYQDVLEEGDVAEGVRSFRIYGHEPGHCDRPDTDAVAVREGYVSVTPVRQRFDDADVRASLRPLEGLDWQVASRPAAGA